MIFIRTDANQEIATGHVMRCAAIARRLEAREEKVCFLVSDKESSILIEQMGFLYRILDSNWRSPGALGELTQLEALFKDCREKEGQFPKLLIDSYTASGHYTQRLSRWAAVIVIDDLFEQDFTADMVINYTLYYDRFDYTGRYGNKNTRLLLGGEFVPLRPEFGIAKKRRDEALADEAAPAVERVWNVLLICGGADPYNAMGQILSAAAGRPGNNLRFHYQVVAGAYNPYKARLKALAEKHENIHVHENVSDMAGLMARCDAAVSAASTVLYECCAMQLPTVFFCIADNQRYDRECFTKDKVMLYAGDLRTEKSAAVKRILEHLDWLYTHPQACREMKKKMAGLVDGQGADRIAQEILRLQKR